MWKRVWSLFLDWAGIRYRPNVSKCWVWDEEEGRIRYLWLNGETWKAELRG